MDQGDPATIRAEIRCAPKDRAFVVHGHRALIDVPDRVGSFGVIGGCQIAAIGAEAEKGLSATLGLEPPDLPVVVDAADLNRPIPEPEGIAGHGGVEGGRDDVRGPMDHTARPLQVGEGQAGDRLIAEQVDAVGCQIQLPRDRGRPPQGVQTGELLSDTPAEPPGLSLGRQRVEQVFSRLAILLAELPCGDRRTGEQDRHQQGGHDAGRRQFRAALAPPPEPLRGPGRPRPDRTALQISPQLIPQLRCRHEPVLGVLGQRFEHQRIEVPRDAMIVLPQRHRRARA